MKCHVNVKCLKLHECVIRLVKCLHFPQLPFFCIRISIICNQIDVIMLYGSCHPPILLATVAVQR